MITDISNAELKELIEKTLNRFQNWKVQVERNPNPRMVHSFRSIVSLIENLSQMTEQKISCSYKELSTNMAVLLHHVAELNMNIINGLHDDDHIDEVEEERIVSSLFLVVKSATELIKIVQDGFGMKKDVLMEVKSPALPES